MAKMIFISYENLKSLLKYDVRNAVDGITKKIASRCAVYSYNNQIFSRPRTHVASVSSGGCGAEDEDDYSYSCGGGSSVGSSGGCGSDGGCGSSRRSYGGGCGSDMSGGC